MEVQIKGALSMVGCVAGGGKKQTKCMLGTPPPPPRIQAPYLDLMYKTHN